MPAESPRIVESKSVKLYLTAFNQTRFASDADVGAAIARDLSRATGAPVDVALTLPRDFAALPQRELAGECLDDLPIAVDDSGLDAGGAGRRGAGGRPRRCARASSGRCAR